MKPSLPTVYSLPLLISIVFLAACSNSNNIPPVDPNLSLREQLTIVVDDAVESGLPGVSLHVQHKGKNISVVAGVVNRDTAAPVTSSSLFHVASSGKPFLATMIIRLVDMGFLQLNDSVDALLDPSMSLLITNSDKITVEMLLAHTSGIQDYWDDPEFGEMVALSLDRIWTPIEVLEFVANSDNHFHPGAEYRYSNTNYVLLGVIAERVTGLPIGMALRQWVFEPAGLENTFGAYENLGQAEIAHGYIPTSIFDNSGLEIDLPADGSDLNTIELLKTNGRGDAPVQSSPADLNSFIRTLIDTNILISDDLKTQMLTPSFHTATGYGLGIDISDNGSTFQHEGGFYGVYSQMSYKPSYDLSYATNVNASFGEYLDLYRQYRNRLSLVLDRLR